MTVRRGTVTAVDERNIVLEEGGKIRQGKMAKVHDGFSPGVGDEVEFELVDSVPDRIRPVGATYRKRVPVVPPAPARRAARAFRNPKNFVPTPTRASTGPLADGVRLHGRWHAEHVSGTLTVRATVLTPLLILDATRATTDEHSHQTMGIRREGAGAIIPATTLKGAVRSLVEAATNSRMAKFGQTTRYTYRQAGRGNARPATVPHQLAPSDLLRPDLRPAERPDQLSPADRMFGWTAGTATGSAAVRGRVAFDDAFLGAPQDFPEPIPLAILSSPKPKQSRFYLGKPNDDGTARPFDDGTPADQVRYDGRGKSLRGRAIYLRHANVDPFEARRAEAKRDDQNISVTGQIAVGELFEFKVQVDDLSLEELGALLWVLDAAPDGRSISIGHARPLGYGCIQTSVSSHRLRTTEALVGHLTSWGDAGSEPDLRVADKALEAFKAAVAVASSLPPEQFHEVPQIRAISLATGDPKNLPDSFPQVIHYPRVGDQIDRDGKNFKWFVENERGRKYSLPDVTDDIGLDYWQ